MRLQILTLVCYLFVLVIATGKLEDKSNIEDQLNRFNLIVDEKEYSRLGEIFTPDVVYDEGPDVPDRPVRGVAAIKDILKKIIPAKVVSYSLLSTKFIKFIPPFDKEGRSDRAAAVSYSSFIFFGAGNLTGESFFLFIKYEDKEIVRTKEPGSGGWRIKNRKAELIVSLNFHKPTCVAYGRPLPAFSKSFHSTLIRAIFRENLSEIPPFWKDK